MSIERCPKCKVGSIETGYGLMGGGIGPYVFCDREDCDYFVKEQDAALALPPPQPTDTGKDTKERPNE